VIVRSGWRLVVLQESGIGKAFLGRMVSDVFEPREGQLCHKKPARLAALFVGYLQLARSQ
jgi:ABC-type oligopeptide transport system ATPase subunit